jgi:hypothetical protein
MALGLVGCLLTADAAAQRKLAPGVLNVVPPEINIRDTHSLPMPLPGLQVEPYVPDTFAQSETLYSSTRAVTFFRDVYQYEFSFLPLRQIRVDATTPDGKPRQVNVWYLVYRVRDVGAAVSYKENEDPKYGHIDRELDFQPAKIDENTLPGRFFGVFRLGGWVYDSQAGTYSFVEYKDQVLPDLQRIIAQEEDPGQQYLDTVQMAQQILEKFPADTDQGGKWGIAIWYNVDPRLDFVSVKIGGLTNAFRLELNPDGTLDIRQKQLQLNFWRPGDVVEQEQDKIIYGIPLTDDALDQTEIAAKYRLPGPVIRGESVNQDNLRTSVLFETDAEIDPLTFDSRVAAELDAGQVAKSVQEAFSAAGLPLGGDASIKTEVSGHRWAISDTWEGQNRSFVIRLHPEFWEKTVDGKIRLIKRLDHLWIYE